MFLDRYPQSSDYCTIPGFEKLTEAQRLRVHEAFERGYRAGNNAGMLIAIGRGLATAKLAIEEALKSKTVRPQQEVPASIFAGLDNCQ